MKKYKAAVIGCGNIFPMHAVSIVRCPNAELVAVCDVKKDRADAKAKEAADALAAKQAQLDASVLQQEALLAEIRDLLKNK